jgi:hypothetical protein
VRINTDALDDVEQEQEEEHDRDPLLRDYRRRNKAYTHLDNSQFKRCILREDLVRLAYTDRKSAVAFLRAHEDDFRRARFDSQAKADMHSALSKDYYGILNNSDIEYIKSVLGPNVPPKRTVANTQYCTSHEYYADPKDFRGWMAELHDSTFVRFRKWMNDSKNLERYMKNLSDVDRDVLCEVFEYQLQRRYVMGFQVKEGLDFNEETDRPWIDRI